MKKTEQADQAKTAPPALPFAATGIEISIAGAKHLLTTVEARQLRDSLNNTLRPDNQIRIDELKRLRQELAERRGWNG